jgi:hypothetical protein
MPIPADLDIADIFNMHHSPIAQAARRERATFFDDTRTWVDPNGYRLSDRLWRQRADLRRELDNMVREAIGRGDDGLKVANDIERYLNPRYAPTRNAKGKIIRDGRKGVLTAKPRSGTGSYPARRLMRTEITRAHGVATQAVARKLGTALRWRLSGSHPKTDRCDAKASGGSRGLPPGTPDGVYKLADFPAYPDHPQCLCHIQHYTIQGDNELVARLRVDYGLASAEETANFSRVFNQASRMRSRGQAVPDSMFAPDILRAPRIAEVPRAPAWKPAMSRAEADRWAAGSIDDRVFAHATRAENYESLAAEGWNLERQSFGRLFGDGVYMTNSETLVTGYADMIAGAGNPARVLRTRVNIRTKLQFDDAETINGAHMWGTFQMRERAIGAADWEAFDAISLEIRTAHEAGEQAYAQFWEARNARLKAENFGFAPKGPVPLTEAERATMAEIQAGRISDPDAQIMTRWANEQGIDAFELVGGPQPQIVVFDPQRVTILED